MVSPKSSWVANYFTYTFLDSTSVCESYQKSFQSSEVIMYMLDNYYTWLMLLCKSGSAQVMRLDPLCCMCCCFFCNICRDHQLPLPGANLQCLYLVQIWLGHKAQDCLWKVSLLMLFLECNIFKTYAQSASLCTQLHINTAHAQCFCTQDNSLQNKYTYLLHFTKYHHRGKHIITQEQHTKGCLTVQFKARLKRSTQCLKLLNECLCPCSVMILLLSVTCIYFCDDDSGYSVVR